MNVAMQTEFDESPLFSSAYQAVRYSITRVGKPSRPASAAAIRSSTSEDHDTSVARSMLKGLAGLDAVGQAGMIMSLLRTQLDDLPLSLLIARAAPRSELCSCGRECCRGYRLNRDWREAIGKIGEAADTAYNNIQGITPGSLDLRNAVVMRVYIKQPSLVEIGRSMRLDPDTVGRHHRLIQNWLFGVRGTVIRESSPGIDGLAWQNAESVLREAGIVG
jgi:hypothetical protein